MREKKEMNVGENVTYILGVNPKTGEPCAENVKGDGTGTRVEPIKSLEPCYSFQNGNCTRGNRCRFSHGGGGYGGRGGGFGRGRGGYGGGFGRGRGGGFGSRGRGYQSQFSDNQQNMQNPNEYQGGDRPMNPQQPPMNNNPPPENMNPPISAQ